MSGNTLLITDASIVSGTAAPNLLLQDKIRVGAFGFFPGQVAAAAGYAPTLLRLFIALLSKTKTQQEPNCQPVHSVLEIETIGSSQAVQHCNMTWQSLDDTRRYRCQNASDVSNSNFLLEVV